MELAEESASEAYEMHTALLSKGFALERPPSVHQVNGRSLMTSHKFDPTSTSTSQHTKILLHKCAPEKKYSPTILARHLR